MMISVEQKGPMSMKLSNGTHQLISDLSTNLGGEDTGLNPHELLEAALGACTAQTLKMYAKRKKWDLKDFKLEVKILQEWPEPIIKRRIYFSDMPDEQKRRLVEIADKCPIDKLLRSSIHIETDRF